MHINQAIPLPVSAEARAGKFSLSEATSIYVDPGSAELRAIGQYLADRLTPATGYRLPVLVTSGPPASGHIYLSTRGADPGLGEEGYELAVSPDGLALAAYQPAGLFRGLQTIRQLLPAEIESPALQSGPWEIAAGRIKDTPRFAWRGVMLDVARHFFGMDAVKRIIDLMAYYKLNHLHLHLSDDQGWRLMINSWPRLATYGGSTQVGGGAGGYYTQTEYSELVAYAQSRYITLVPEIDMPGHTQAALASYAELNRDKEEAPLYTGILVGFSSLCVKKEITFRFVEDVLGEVAALTAGPYLHIGGDEALTTSEADYLQFLERVQAIVQALGKHMIGWEDIARIPLPPTTLVQHWHNILAQQAARQGAKVIMSPASRAYLDMKYDASTPLGLNWAGHIDVETAYSWDPATELEGVSESDVLGVEAPLWSETLQSMQDIEFLAFPRLPGYAEIGWSPQQARNWEEYRLHLAAHGPRLAAMGVNFYRSPLIPWP
jgi:hexosaminidase